MNAGDPYWADMARAGGLLGHQHALSQAQLSGHSHGIMGMTSSYSQWSPEAMKRMICMRLNIQEGYTHGFHFLECCKLNDKEVAVFVVTDGEPIVIKDGTDLFPSDTLITQLRLLKK
jgi:hypothetical protein